LREDLIQHVVAFGGLAKGPPIVNESQLIQRVVLDPETLRQGRA